MSSISIKDYPEVESTQRTAKEIEELKSIILSIEKKTDGTLKLNLSYVSGYNAFYHIRTGSWLK